LVAKAYAQREGIDYNKVFLPIVTLVYSDFVGTSSTVRVKT